MQRNRCTSSGESLRSLFFDRFGPASSTGPTGDTGLAGDTGPTKGRQVGQSRSGWPDSASSHHCLVPVLTAAGRQQSDWLAVIGYLEGGPLVGDPLEINREVLAELPDPYRLHNVPAMTHMVAQ